MRSFAAATLAFAAAVSAQTSGYYAINLPGMNEVVPACSTYTIVWTPNDDYSGDVTFQLIGGATQQTLVAIGDMFGNVDGSVGSYEWSVPCDAGVDAIYGLKIYQVSDTSVFQYSMPFEIEAADDASATTSATSATATVTTQTSDETTTMTPEPTEPTNSTATTMDVSDDCTTTTTTPATNGTITTHKPTQAYTTMTSITTAASTNGTSSETAVPVAGASRMAGGSVAFLAVAAAFLAL